MEGAIRNREQASHPRQQVPFSILFIGSSLRAILVRVLHEELAHMVMEAEKSHELPSAAGDAGKKVV